MRKFLYDGLNNHKSKQFIPIHVFIMAVTIVAIAGIILENFPDFEVYKPMFLLVEWTTVIIFTAEYLARIIVSKKRIGYILSIWGLLDLVSILPTYLGLGDWAFLKSFRMIRILKLVRTTHLSKIPESYAESRRKS